MPEGHKTHYLAAQHAAAIGGQAIQVTSPQGRFADDARKVDGRRLDEIRAVGKHLFYEFDGRRIVHVHLGRYGSFTQQTSPPTDPKGQVRMRMIGPGTTIDLRGPSRCRVIDGDTETAIRDSLGPDPLAGGRKRDVFAKIHTSGKPIGALLLDQSIIAGIGNIFRAEILFEIRMDPNLPGNEISPAQFDVLWKSITSMMKVSLKHGRIISVTAKEAGKPLAQLTDQERFRVYGRRDCPACGGSIVTEPFASRKLYLCPNCQLGPTAKP